MSESTDPLQTKVEMKNQELVSVERGRAHDGLLKGLLPSLGALGVFVALFPRGAVADATVNIGAVAETPVLGFGGSPEAFGVEAAFLIDAAKLRPGLWLGARVSWLEWGPPPDGGSVFGYGLFGGGLTTGSSSAWVFTFDGCARVLDSNDLGLEVTFGLGVRRWSFTDMQSGGGGATLSAGTGVYPELDLGARAVLNLSPRISLRLELRAVTLANIGIGPQGNRNPSSDVGLGLDAVAGLGVQF